MTWPKHFTLEQQREAQREKNKKYRLTHPRSSEYQKKREKRKFVIFEGKHCKACEIPLVSSYGAYKTRTFCSRCSSDKKMAHRISSQLSKRKIRRLKKTENRKKL